jgi:hypothetical protein
MEIGSSVEEVEAVVGFFYKKVRSTLGTLKAPAVRIPNLGNFYIKEDTLDREIIKYDKVLENLSDTDFTEYGLKKDLKQRYDLMVEMKKKLDEERQRRVAVINKRYNNESKDKHNPTMEEQGSDLGGSEE